MGARRVRLGGAPRVRVHPMGAHRAGLPRRRRLGPGGPRRLLRRRCLRSRRPARSGQPRPRPPSNQLNQPSRTSRANQAGRVSRAGRPSRTSRASQVGRVVSRAGRASRAGRFGLVGRVCRVGVLLGRAPQVPRGLLPGLRPPRACRPARGQAHLLPRPGQDPKPGPRPQPGRLSRRRVAAPVGPPRGTPPVVVLVGAAPTPRPGQRPAPRPVPGLGPRLVRRRARPVPPPLAHARRPRTRSRPARPPPATPNETVP